MLVLGAMTPASEITPAVGLEIRQSGRVVRGDYLLPSPAGGEFQPAIVISGSNITVDFDGAVLRGTPATTEPDERTGLGVLVTGKNVTIRNLRVHGYKVGLWAQDADGLKLVDSDFSWNWKQRLKSGLDKEDLADWMSFHRNEQDEWLRYGAAIYVRGSDGIEVRNCTAVGGQCGLMMMESNRGLIWNNNFSFLSAVGLGLYLSSENRIMHNNIDWCVRGYSHGVYNRGQDSTGILIYEQSNKNIFAYNSVTHGGDGFFLWAGQTTMDTGQGGCNDNLLFGNDFSHAPTNGIEATFSRNVFANNLVLECWHGVWGGYSYDTEMVGNVFGFNAEAIALEHGQDNIVRGNVFLRDLVAIKAWANTSQDPNWGYPKFRDTKSRDWTVRENAFVDIGATVFDVTRTSGFRVATNLIDRAGQVTKFEEGVGATVRGNRILSAANVENGLGLANTLGESRLKKSPPTMLPSGNAILAGQYDRTEYLSRFETGWDPWARAWRTPKVLQEMLTASAERALEARIEELRPAPLPGGKDPFLKLGTLRGRRYILVDQWGPYDFQRPVLWPRLPVTTSADGKTQTQRFEILGPVGRWTLKGAEGATVSATSGTVPGMVEVTTRLDEPPVKVDVQMEYVGARTTDYRGIVSAPGTRVPFSWGQVNVPIAWTVRFYGWDKDVSDPRTQADAFARVLAGQPLAEMKTSRLEGAWYRSPMAGVPENYFATVAEGVVKAPAGRYRLEVTTDDGVRVWLNGGMVLESWQYQGPTSYTAEVTLTGNDTLRVNHFEIDGFATLNVKLVPLP